jgi:acetylornithine deacetylase/succinyl-diaminopimelate desuccinylase-like protein
VRIVLTADEEVGSPSGGAVVTAACAGARAAYGVEPPLADGTLKVGRRGVARFRLEVTGRAAHAGLDAEAGVSAVDELVDQLTALRRAVPGTTSRSINVGRISGGTRANVVAGTADAEIGTRFATAADEAALLAAFDTMAPIRPGPRERFVPRDPDDDAIAMHRRPGIFCGNENVRLARLICDQETVARLMDRQFSGNQIGLGRQDVTILADPSDVARAFQLAQDFV